MEDFVKCFGEVGVDYINLMMTDERLDANVDLGASSISTIKSPRPTFWSFEQDFKIFGFSSHGVSFHFVPAGMNRSR